MYLFLLLRLMNSALSESALYLCPGPFSFDNYLLPSHSLPFLWTIASKSLLTAHSDSYLHLTCWWFFLFSGSSSFTPPVFRTSTSGCWAFHIPEKEILSSPQPTGRKPGLLSTPSILVYAIGVCSLVHLMGFPDASYILIKCYPTRLTSKLISAPPELIDLIYFDLPLEIGVMFIWAVVSKNHLHLMTGTAVLYYIF